MLHFERISIGQRHYMMRELTFNHAIKIARIPEAKNEQRLTVFLQDVLQDELLPLQMTVQERYYLLLKYLDAQQNSLLAIKLDIADFLILPVGRWNTQYEQDDIIVKQLTGYDVELLENHCGNLADWIAASLALQLHDSKSDMPPMLYHALDEQEKMQRFVERLKYVRDMPLSQFNAYHAILNLANSEMQSLVRLGFDGQGITIRGTDDAPHRFCPSSTFYGIVARLDGYFNQQSPAIGDRLQYEHERSFEYAD